MCVRHRVTGGRGTRDRIGVRPGPIGARDHRILDFFHRVHDRRRRSRVLRQVRPRVGQLCGLPLFVRTRAQRRQLVGQLRAVRQQLDLDRLRSDAVLVIVIGPALNYRHGRGEVFVGNGDLGVHVLAFLDLALGSIGRSSIFFCRIVPGSAGERGIDRIVGVFREDRIDILPVCGQSVRTRQNLVNVEGRARNEIRDLHRKADGDRVDQTIRAGIIGHRCIAVIYERIVYVFIIVAVLPFDVV